MQRAALTRRLLEEMSAVSGVPVSVKDSIDVRGYDSTCGSAARVFRPSAEDAFHVAALRDAGAIVVVRGSSAMALWRWSEPA